MTRWRFWNQSTAEQLEQQHFKKGMQIKAMIFFLNQFSILGIL